MIQFLPIFGYKGCLCFDPPVIPGFIINFLILNSLSGSGYNKEENIYFGIIQPEICFQLTPAQENGSYICFLFILDFNFVVDCFEIFFIISLTFSFHIWFRSFLSIHYYSCRSVSKYFYIDLKKARNIKWIRFALASRNSQLLNISDERVISLSDTQLMLHYKDAQIC